MSFSRWACCLMLAVAVWGQDTSTVATPNRVTREIYETFFQQIVTLQGLAQGRIVAPVKRMPRIQDVIGLTDAEVESLNRIVRDWSAKLPQHGYAPGMIMESRLQQIEYGRVLEPLAARLKDIDDRHDEMVVEYLRQLRSELGDVRFQLLDAYVRSPMRNPKDLEPMYDVPFAVPVSKR